MFGLLASESRLTVIDEGEKTPRGGEYGDRRILHCDMDCFYAAIHMRDDPTLEGRPVVVGGQPKSRGVVAAANYEARKFGIRSAIPSSQAFRLNPQTVFIRPDFPRYKLESEAIFSIFREHTPWVQPASLDEAYLDVSDFLQPWGSATEVAREIRRRVLEERRLTVSVGVGPNRLVAKIASDFDKPDGLTVVKPHQVMGFLEPLKVRRLHGVGPATEKVLATLGIRTIAELRKVDRETLDGRFGRYGTVLFRSARGLDDRPVRTDRVRKSLGAERTYAEDLDDLEAIDGELVRFSHSLAESLKRREIVARTFTVKVRYSNFETVTRSLSLPGCTQDSVEILAVSRTLLTRTEAGTRSVRLLGVTASKLQPEGQESQLRLF